MTTETKTTVVLVHGAFAESASWNGVIGELAARGVTSIAVANPLRRLATDSEYLASVLAGIEGPVILAGHSYGGMLATEVGAAAPGVKGLVYVAAFAPETGESGQILSGKFPGSSLGDTLVITPLNDGSNDLRIEQGKYQHQFMADVPDADAIPAAATQRPVTDQALADALQTSSPAWKALPSWFAFGDSDLNIPVAVHRFLADRARAKSVTEIAGASHSVAVSHPAEIAEVILEAIAATSE